MNHKQIQKNPIIKTLKYSWPGNVRELQNLVERSVSMSAGPIIYEEDLLLPVSEVGELEHPVPELEEGQTLRDLIKKLELSVIENKLKENQGNKMKTAKDLGISRRALLYKIQEYGIGT